MTASGNSALFPLASGSNKTDLNSGFMLSLPLGRSSPPYSSDFLSVVAGSSSHETGARGGFKTRRFTSPMVLANLYNIPATLALWIWKRPEKFGRSLSFRLRPCRLAGPFFVQGSHMKERIENRVPTWFHTEARFPDDSAIVCVMDISTFGCRLLIDSRVPKIGMTLVLKLAEERYASGEIVRVIENDCGVRFHRPLPIELIDQVAAR